MQKTNKFYVKIANTSTVFLKKTKTKQMNKYSLYMIAFEQDVLVGFIFLNVPEQSFSQG